MTSAYSLKNICSSPIKSASSHGTRRLRLLLVLFAALPLLVGRADETPSLMTMVSEWRYPDSKVNGAKLSDGATLNASGKRSVQSIAYQSVFTTRDSISEIIAYYKDKLSSPISPDRLVASEKLNSSSGRSVKFYEDSDGRSVEVQMILINTEKSSTTLVLTRAAMESKTHIAWMHYARF